MWICPVCGKQNEVNLLCAGCGFDESSNYEKYCTLAVVKPRAGFSGHKERKQYGWEDVYHRGLDCLEIGDHKTAVRYLKLAAEHGEAGAQYHLGRWYFLGENGLLDYAGGIRWLEEARKGGYKEAETFLEEQVYGLEGGAGLNVYNWYRMLAEKGNADAQIYLGDYWGNYGTPEGNEEAAKWYRRAADAGSPKGKWKLGSCYYSGKGVECNQEKAFEYYRMAAREGDNVAQSLLGMCYEFGNGVQMNLLEAVYWYQEAASQGNQEAAKRVRALVKM